jgi:hypothetical protein
MGMWGDYLKQAKKAKQKAAKAPEGRFQNSERKNLSKNKAKKCS